MHKKIIVLSMIIICIFTACSTKQKDSTKAGSENSTQVKIDYSKYTGNWVTETNLKNDFLFGITAGLTVDKEGNVKGQIGDCTENATHISNVDISGIIKDNKLTYKFDEDGWEHKGTINMEFNDNTITLNIVYDPDSSKDNFWGIGEGTFVLINNKTEVKRTLSNLKDGGLQVINDQSFDINLENYGKVKFISGLKREDGTEVVLFYLIGENNQVLYKFPSFYGNGKSRFVDIKAVSFVDVDSNGLKDVVIMAEYDDRIVSSIYYQKGKEFANNITLDDKINASPPKTISDVIKLAKEIK